MSEDQKKQLEQQLWNIANELRGKMNADEFRDYILGFIFYKYLAEKMNIYANSILKPDGITYKEIKENSDDILFIDASRHFKKVKTQNQLRPEDINKIIDTYRNRSEEDKYSYVASLKEVTENDYNLNIPRYVDTFEEEEPIDIDAVASELVELDVEMKETDKLIAGFCKELGINTPF